MLGVVFGSESAERRERMRKILRESSTADELKTRTLLFVLDPSYARSDIATVMSEVEREKGWKNA